MTVELLSRARTWLSQLRQTVADRDEQDLIESIIEALDPEAYLTVGTRKEIQDWLSTQKRQLIGRGCDGILTLVRALEIELCS